MRRKRMPLEVETRVRAAAKQRCGYCLSPQHLVMARLELEHLIPVAKGGNDVESNHWLSCPLCNRYKSDRTSGRDSQTGADVPLFKPRRQQWSEHISWSPDFIRIVGRPPRAGRRLPRCTSMM